MTRYTPLWEQAGSYAASVDRRLIGTIWPAAYVSGCAVTVAAGTMNTNIAPGAVVAPAANNTGSVLCYSDAVEVVTSTAAPGGGTNRYDLIVCQPRGNDLDGGSNNDFVFSAIAGTASASPAPPATPAGAVALAQVLVIGGSASLSGANLTDLRPLNATGRRLANIERTTSPTAAAAEQVVVTTPAIYVPANRLIRVAATWWNTVGGAGDGVGVRIREGTTVAGTALVGNVVVMSPSGSQVGSGNGGGFDYSYAPSAGLKQWVLTCASLTAAAAAIQGGVGIPIQLAVFDVT